MMQSVAARLAPTPGLRQAECSRVPSHWLRAERHENRAFPAKEPLFSKLLAACRLRRPQGGGGTPARAAPLPYARPCYLGNGSRGRSESQRAGPRKKRRNCATRWAGTQLRDSTVPRKEILPGGICLSVLGHMVLTTASIFHAGSKPDRNKCFKCGRSGPQTQECSTRGGHGFGMRSYGKDICYRCDESGHLAKECDLQENEACSHCHRGGHIAKDCKEPKREQEQCCYNCGKPGHLAHDSGHADEQECYSCREFGHIQTDCTKVKCYRCGKIGHVAINSSKTSEANCYRCGESEHLAQECTTEATT
ncbi:PREDICTED: cellular nucleic acid-binding protein-like [Chrysochloris asiatica]|uniref:Cellular nucleic acid-binding protein-like n=1 Tax=Chrysochloris asiatica TaxID=185453 RepID=A0A9B0X0I4_CHRAS|nr:PREDICTED: cellular nucleic acid-binding protein-like [Chrysochloris asiatica]